MKLNLKVGKKPSSIVPSVKTFYDYKRDGVTQGLLATWMRCRQEARLFLQGWSPKKTVSEGLTYGTIIHGVLEQVYDMIRLRQLVHPPQSKLIVKLLAGVETQWKKDNPVVSKEITEMLEMSLLIAEATLPVYFQHNWKADFKEIKWKSLEQQFAIPYKLKDGRIILIKGKKDGIFGNPDPSIWLFETKTKSIISESNLVDTLWFELQVNLYLWAVKKTYNKIPKGVVYNVIRRTCLDKKKSENLVQYSNRVKEDIMNRPEFYFMRFEIFITPKEMELWEKELEGMVTDFIDWCEGKVPHYKNTGSCERKYGRCPMLTICSSGDYTQYAKRKTVFRELEDF